MKRIISLILALLMIMSSVVMMVACGGGSEEDETKKSGYIALLILCRDILETCIDVLGFDAPERM